MKRALLLCEGLADGPVAQIGGRTPLEVARTPHLDRLAAAGRIGSVSFVPAQVRPGPETAVLSALGYDPARHFTGTAALEALAHGIDLDDRQAVFRCDLVTVDGPVLADAAAGGITTREATELVAALKASSERFGFRLLPIGGQRCLLLVSDGRAADEFDDLECARPDEVRGRKWDKHLPQGKGAERLLEWMQEAARTLEQHEINRVRIDLKENPANRVWPWGQGRRPQLPSFESQWGLAGGVVAENEAVRGAALAAGLKPFPDAASALEAVDFVVVHWSPFTDGRGVWELKAKIKFIEDFDSQIVGPVWALMGGGESGRVLAASDTVSPLDRGVPIHGHVPVVAAGALVGSEPADAFHEKITSQSRWSFEDGRRLLEFFLKN